jgi:protein phosphatase
MTRIVGRSHPGRRGGENEDAIGWDLDRGLAFVADGMGGHASGHIASRVVKETMLRNAGEKVLRDAVLQSHEAIAAAASQDQRSHGMGSTIVAARVSGSTASVSWVGDSRAYLWRRGVLKCLTRDHSYLELLREQQQLSDTQIRGHPHKNLITQTLGIGTPDPSALDVRLKRGDLLVLCSDGLNDELTDEEIAAILERAPNVEAAADALIAGALGKGGRDNVSVVIVEQDTKPGAGLSQSARIGVAVGFGIAAALLAAAVWWLLRQAP